MEGKGKKQTQNTAFLKIERKKKTGTFLAVQWLRLCASSVRVGREAIGFDIPGQGTKILHVGYAVEPKHLKRRTKKTPRRLTLPKHQINQRIIFQNLALLQFHY